jgi:hypothetical protein
MKLKRRIEDSRQAVKRIYTKEILLLSTASPQITQIAPVVHEIKRVFFKIRNDLVIHPHPQQ